MDVFHYGTTELIEDETIWGEVQEMSHSSEKTETAWHAETARITIGYEACAGINCRGQYFNPEIIIEGGKTFTVQSSTTDSFDVAISYLNIKKEIVT